MLAAAAEASRDLGWETGVVQKEDASLKLRNLQLVKLIQGVQQAGLCTKSEAEFIIIAALNRTGRLPYGGAVIR